MGCSFPPWFSTQEETKTKNPRHTFWSIQVAIVFHHSFVVFPNGQPAQRAQRGLKRPLPAAADCSRTPWMVSDESRHRASQQFWYCVCVWKVWIDVKLRRRFTIFYLCFSLQQGITGVPGVGDQRRHLPGTRVNVPAGLWWCAAFKSQLVATTAHIYICVCVYMYTTNLIACDGIQFPTDHYNDPFLVYCDFDGGFDMVPWTHLREPFLRWMLTDWTSELTHFNVVIRLSKAKQSAIPLTTFFWRLAAPAVLANPGTISNLLKWSCTEQPQTFLFQHGDRTTARIHERCQVHAFRCGLLSFDCSLVRLNILCT